MSMPALPEATADEAEDDEGTYVPEPPRRVPFAIALVTVLLGILSVLVVAMAATLMTVFRADLNLARSAGVGLLLLVLFLIGAAVGTVAWSFVRNGNQIGALVAGGAVAVLGLVGIVQGLVSDYGSQGVAYGLIGLFFGLVIALVPLIGDGPAYLAARRTWAKAEHEWLRELVAAGRPPQPVWHPGMAQPWQMQQPLHQQWPQQPYPQQQPYPPQQQPYPQQQPWPQQQPQQPWAQRPPQQQQPQHWGPPAPGQAPAGPPPPPEQPASGPPRQ